MPKRFSEYTAGEWLRLRPLTQGYKVLRYNAADARHRRLAPRGGDLAKAVAAIAGRRVLITVAFEDAQAIEWQIRLLRRYVTCDVHVIADNSPDNAEAAAIAKECEAAGVIYLRLPATSARASRGHGLVLNWLWTNLVLPGRPSAFGFLDDDLFPTQPDDPFAPLATQDFYGYVRRAGERWFLWAGYCTFRFDAVGDKPLDFRQDWFIGLDTGGGNWDVLYRHADLDKLKHAPMSQTPYRDGVPQSESYFQWCNGWLHEVGSGGRAELEADKRAVAAELLKPHLAGT